MKCLLILSALLTLTAGCTSALWARKDYSAKDVKLLLEPGTGQVLVTYKEECFTNSFNMWSEKRDIQQRSYWLYSWTNAPKHSMPGFAQVTNSADWATIPCLVLNGKRPTSAFATNRVFFPVLVTNVAPEHGYYVIPAYTSFELWKDRQKVGAFKLPQRPSEWGAVTFPRVVLTPITATADAIVIPIAGVLIVTQGHAIEAVRFAQ